MRKQIFSLMCALSALAVAQTADPIIMRVNGVPVTRSEFEYSYNKNASADAETGSVASYVPMFVDYRLKVAAAKAQRLDTLSSFRQEFLTYRDMQLTPFMVDEVYIDSVARSLYDQSAKQVDGRPLLRPSHILLRVKQNASAAEAEQQRLRADSVYDALKAGARFEELAAQLSDDQGTARKGGQLPWVGPGNTVKEFEEAIYAMQPGEISKPVKTVVGYHVIRLDSLKYLEPYEELRPQIVKALKRQGIEEQSAEERIKRIVAASGGLKTRESVLDSVLAAHNDSAELKYLVKEYYDGLLCFELSKRRVFDVAEKDTARLEQQFKANKKRYRWTEPRFKGFVLHAKRAADLPRAKAVLKKAASADWKKAVKEQINKDSVTVMVSGPYFVKRGENRYIDQFAFGGKETAPNPKYPHPAVQGKLQKQPKTWRDVQQVVTSDVQDQLTREWLDELRRQFDVEIYEDVVKTVNKHD